ncbi:MAG: glycosyltransferase [Bacteroidales bacterium]|nr:glycosyltransferase [Bacteroidales bacterium]
MPKFLQINTTVNTGSTGRIAEEIGQRALATGYDSFIAYGRTARESKSKLIRIGSKWDYYLHGLKSLLFDAHGFGSIKATKQFVKQMDKISPDVILFHNIHGYYLNMEILLSYLKDKDIPIFWTLHDCWPFTGHCSYFDAYECEKWKTHCEHCPNQKGYPKSLLFDKSRNNYDRKKALLTALPNVTFVPVCEWMGSVVDASYMKGSCKQVIYNGTNIEVFQPQKSQTIEETRSKYSIRQGKVILGVASVWDKRKGLDDFVWLNEHLPQNCQVVLVGLTETQIKALPSGIIGVRRTESVQELAVLYSLADVFVNPTYVDNFPTTNIEALACGTPVITYNTGGSPEAIDENTGRVVEKGNKDVLLQAISDVVSSNDKYTKEMCRQRAVEHFNKDDRFDDYIRLFNKALNKE